MASSSSSSDFERDDGKFLVTHDAQCSSACDDPFLSVLLTVLDRYIASAKRAKHAMQEKLIKKPKKKTEGKSGSRPWGSDSGNLYNLIITAT